VSTAVLVDVATLAAELAQDRCDLRLVDARAVLGDAQAGREAFAAGHLPGAVHADLERDLSDHAAHGQGRHPLPASQAFRATLGRWGIGPAQRVLVYDAGDGSMAAARLWWLLRLLGHSQVAVLDGGLAAWQAAGHGQTREQAVAPDPGPYPGDFDRARIVDAGEVRARLDEPCGWLIDARAAPRFAGEVEPIDAVAGHVPGAINRPYAANLRDGRFRPPAELCAELEALLHGRDPADAVLMCGSGVTACHLLLGFEHAGLAGPRVYAGSWSGWISDPGRPVARGPG